MSSARAARHPIILALVLLLGTLTVTTALGRSPAMAEGEAPSPQGNLDGVQSLQPGTLRTNGWAYDGNNTAAALAIHVYVGGPAGTPGTDFVQTTANLSRPDVDSATGSGPNHGFDITFTTGRRGNVDLYVYAINIGDGGNTFLGTKSATVEDPDPKGSFDQVSGPTSNTITVAGWAFDRSSPSSSVSIRAYVGGPAGSGDPADLGPAGLPRADVGSAYPGVGDNHGFAASFSTFRTGQQTVYVYALNLAGSVGTDTFLGSKSVFVPLPVIRPVRGSTIVGKARVGKRVSAGRPLWSDRFVATTYQWLRNGVAIPGATKERYLLRKDDRGAVIAVLATGTRSGYTPGTAVSTLGKVKGHSSKSRKAHKGKKKR